MTFRLAMSMTALLALGGSSALGALPQQSGAVDLLTEANLRMVGGAAGDMAGVSVAGAGDVNGDGIRDVIVGAYKADGNGRTDSGSAYVLFGTSSTTGIDLADLGSRGFRIDGAAPGDWAGISVAGAGDIDGDGRDDVVVGADNADANGRTDSGSAYVVFGTTAPATVDLADLGSRGFSIDGAAPGDWAGRQVAGTGDVNGDGRDDVIVGAIHPGNNGRLDSGSAYVVFGSANPTAVDLASLGARGLRIDGAAAGDWAGVRVAAAGDVNGDGLRDVVVGAYVADNNGRATSGSAYVVFGAAGAGTIDLAGLGGRGFRIDGAQAGDYTGYGVAGAGDVNGDGRDDVIVGAVLASPRALAYSGSAYVVFGRTGTTAIDLASLGTDGIRIDGAAAADWTGYAVAGAGDVNGDGRDDVIIGSALADHRARGDSGSASVVFGGDGLGTIDLGSLGSRGVHIDGAGGDNQAGDAVAGAGDVNGDGRDDVIVGAFGADEAGRLEGGTASIIFGFGVPTLSYDNLSGTVGEPVTLAPAGIARTGTPSFSVSPALPPGLSLDPFTGTVSGTPAAPLDTTLFAVTMTDLAGSATVPLSLEVAAAPVAPSPPSPGSPEGPAVPADSVAPGISLRGAATLRRPRTISLLVRCDEDCRLVASVTGRARATTTDLVAGRWTRVRVALPASAGGRTRLRLHLAASDDAGNRSTIVSRVAVTR